MILTFGKRTDEIRAYAKVVYSHSKITRDDLDNVVTSLLQSDKHIFYKDDCLGKGIMAHMFFLLISPNFAEHFKHMQTFIDREKYPFEVGIDNEIGTIGNLRVCIDPLLKINEIIVVSRGTDQHFSTLTLPVSEMLLLKEQ